MRMGIKARLLFILLLAAGVPLTVGLYSAHYFGHRYLLNSKGTLFNYMAARISDSLEKVVDNEIESISDWVTLSELPDVIEEYIDGNQQYFDEVYQQLETLDEGWPSYQISNTYVENVLKNSVAQMIREFQARHPLFVEILVTDTQGLLIGASSKTTNLWQADEEWWKAATDLDRETVWIEGISFDFSADVYALDVVMPVYKRNKDKFHQIGVIKCVMDSAPLLALIKGGNEEVHPMRQILVHDLNIPEQAEFDFLTPGQKGFSSLAAKILEHDSGWMVSEKVDDKEELAGFSKIQLSEVSGSIGRILKIKPMHIVVHDDLDYVMSSVNRQIWLFILFGGIIIVISILTALHFADRKILTPLRLLRSAAQGISETARLKNIENNQYVASELSTDQAARTLVDKVRTIQTGDELEQLAEDFSLMARRVLDYHQQLEREIDIKTEELQRDLKLAREFQEAMLPKEHHDLPEHAAIGALELHFDHIYKPAFLVGGDFFDVTEISDTCAGIFIADVVGHGTRSALITSILRSLLQNLRHLATEPDMLINALNRHFYSIMPHRHECLFATIFYLVLDTATRTASYVSAGHPAPLLLDRENKEISSLSDGMPKNPAIGMFPSVSYKSAARMIKDGDTFVLYTDGITEALNDRGEQFGQQRLCELLQLSLEQERHDLNALVLTALHRFMDTVVSADDICMVTADVRTHHAFVPPEKVSEKLKEQK